MNGNCCVKKRNPCCNENEVRAFIYYKKNKCEQKTNTTETTDETQKNLNTRDLSVIVSPYNTPDYTSDGIGGSPVYKNNLEWVKNNTKTTNHGIYGYDPIQKSDFTPWNGQPVDICTMTKAERCNFFNPGNKGLLPGIEDLYNKTKPFKDEENPTIEEYENWGLTVINHFRSLFGGQAAVLSRELFLSTQWATEKQFSTIWDAKYPNEKSCANYVAEKDWHCGFGFVPSCADQAPYLKPGEQCVTSKGGDAEGKIGIWKRFPWAFHISFLITKIICLEELGGHIGPFMDGKEFGWALHDVDKDMLEFRYQSKGNFDKCNLLKKTQPKP